MIKFDPVLYSLKENEFLLTVLGEAPIVAMRKVPSDVNPQAVRPPIQAVYDLMELERASNVPWIGVEAIKNTIKAYLEQSVRWSADRRRGAPRFPSFHSFDSRKRAHRAGPGSDAYKVNTYFDKAGQRIPFAVDLVPADATNWTPDWDTNPTPSEPTKGLTVNAEAHRIECGICQHTESFNPDSRGSYNAARARISKHLRLSKENVDQHRELYTNEFGN